MPPTISDTAYAILRALYARTGPVSDTGVRTVVGTSEIREAIGKDPHPVLGRDVIGRGWALKWEGISELHSPAFAKDRIAGVVFTELGQAAFELGRRERGDNLPAPVGPPILRTGMARFMD
jgi:hypothetical protein